MTSPDLRQRVLDRLDEIERTAAACPPRRSYTFRELHPAFQASTCDVCAEAKDCVIECVETEAWFCRDCAAEQQHDAQQSPSSVLRWVRALRELAEQHGGDYVSVPSGLNGDDTPEVCCLGCDEPLPCPVVASLAAALGVGEP